MPIFDKICSMLSFYLLSSLKNRLPDSSNFLFWIFFSFIVKGIMYYYFMSPTDFLYDGIIGTEWGDSKTYFEPIENFIHNSEYFDDYRLPGYGFIYYLFRFFSNQTTSLNLVLITQLVVSSISVYFFSKILENLFFTSTAFYFSFFLFLISTYVSLWDSALLTESFSTSFIIFSVYSLLKDSRKYYFVSGLFLTWSIFMRPVLVPLLVLYTIYIFLIEFKKKSSTFKNLIQSMLIFLLPFIIVDSLWTLRNYNKYNYVYPLTKTMYKIDPSEEYMLGLYEFMKSFGGSYVWWQDGSDITFFRTSATREMKKVDLKNYYFIYTSEFNYDSLVYVRDMINDLKENKLTLAEIKMRNNLINEKLYRYANSIKKEKPFLYYFISRCRILKSFVFHSGTYNLFKIPFSELSILSKAVKLFYTTLYYFVIIFGFLSSIILLIINLKDYKILFLVFLGNYLFLVYPIVLLMDEYRYFVTAYPFLLIFPIILAFTLIRKKI